MEVIKVVVVPQEDGRLVLEDGAFHRGVPVEVMIRQPSPSLPPTGTVGDLLDTAFGIWADRDDIGDGVEYAHKLRRHLDENLRGR